MNTLPSPIHGDWVDSMADWAVRNPLIASRPEFAPTQAEVRQHCSACESRECPTPDACEQPEQDPHARQRRGIVILVVVLGAAICAVCLAGYREALPW